MTPAVVVPWHNPRQRDRFLEAWGLDEDAIPSWLILQQDVHGVGCGATKNAGVRVALERGHDVVGILDDDCEPDQGQSLEEWLTAHLDALEPVEIPLFQLVTDPPSRGTPYHQRTITMPVAASMGFWTQVGDYDAPSQLVRGAQTPMTFRREPIYGQYFALCGMNLAFRPAAWRPWCQFIEHAPRFDDIWMGWLWQREAYRRGACFNLRGPMVRHSRQSNVWQNLRDEVAYLERNETLWVDIVRADVDDYQALRRLLP